MLAGRPSESLYKPADFTFSGWTGRKRIHAEVRVERMIRTRKSRPYRRWEQGQRSVGAHADTRTRRYADTLFIVADVPLQRPSTAIRSAK